MEMRASRQVGGVTAWKKASQSIPGGGLEHIPSDRYAWILVRDVVEENGLLGVASGECVVRHPLADRAEGILKVGTGYRILRAREVTLFGQLIVFP